LSIDLEPARYRLPRVAFKRFPIQIELQAVAEIGASLSAKIKGAPSTIRAITVETYPGIIARVADPPKFQPKTKGTADHSLPICLAMALLDGDVTIEQFEKNRWQAPDVLALVANTKVNPSEALMAKIPKGPGATVKITLADGTTLQETVEVAEGDADRPLSRASLERKFTNFATPVIGNEGAKRIVALVDNLADLKSIRELTRALRGMGKQNPT
jgi:2-methylcitrate dehydratase